MNISVWGVMYEQGNRVVCGGMKSRRTAQPHEGEPTENRRGVASTAASPNRALPPSLPASSLRLQLEFCPQADGSDSCPSLTAWLPLNRVQVEVSFRCKVFLKRLMSADCLQSFYNCENNTTHLHFYSGDGRKQQDGSLYK